MRNTYVSHAPSLAYYHTTYNLEFVLPELLLLGFVQEGEIPNMVHKYIAQQRKLRVFWRNLTSI